MPSTWRDRASILSVIAGAVAVVVLFVEGPPGSGYGWGSVVVSAAILGGLFLLMAYLVRSDSRGNAWGAAIVAVLVVVILGAALLGNWGGQTATYRVLDTISTLFALVAGAVVLAVASSTIRHH